MEFSCDECQAKYRIADERAAGKTLKMKCRHCGHVILIRGRAAAPAHAPEPEEAPNERAAPAEEAPPAEALGERSGEADGALPPLTSVAPAWHVAIDDVPVGPLPREEIEAKLRAGAIDGSSLCWREGLEDWRPLGQIPELTEVLEAASSANAPAAELAAPPLPSAKAPVPSLPGAPESPGGAPAEAEAAPAVPSLPGAPESPGGVPAEAEAAPAALEVSGAKLTLDAGSASPAEPPPRARSMGALWLGWLVFGLLCGAAGYFLADLRHARLEEAPAGAAASPAEPAPAALAPSDEAPYGGDEAAEDGPEAPDVEERAPRKAPTAARQPRAARRPATRTTPTTQSAPVASTNDAPKKAPERELTAEEKRLLERYGGSGSTSSGLGSTGGSGSSAGSSSSAAPSLDASAVQKVVSANKASIQQCYERVTRGMPAVQAIRINVSVKVGSSGIVTRAIVAGDSVPGLNACIEAAVKRWHFPSGGEARFPVVFPAS